MEPHNTVLQSEMYALFRALTAVRKSRERSVNILSDSRSLLDLLRSPQETHPLALEMKECIREIRQEGRSMRLFWLRAHVGTPGNKRADELAKKAATTKKTAPNYDKVPTSYLRRRERTVERWQERYEVTSSQIGFVTKIFLLNTQIANRIIRKSYIIINRQNI